jgi:hypothetical protein
VCERESERGEWVWGVDRECVCERDRQSVCVCVCVCVCLRERESVYLRERECVCVCVFEREKEREGKLEAPPLSWFSFQVRKLKKFWLLPFRQPAATSSQSYKTFFSVKTFFCKPSSMFAIMVGAYPSVAPGPTRSVEPRGLTRNY